MTEPNDPSLPRRSFLKLSLSAAALGMAPGGVRAGWAAPPDRITVDDFARPDALYHGEGWESLSPGYWMIRGRALRRRLHNRGDRRPGMLFPWHWESGRGEPRPAEYDPSLPFGMIWRRDWHLRGDYSLMVEATVRALPPEGRDPRWQQHRPGYALMGVGFGSRCLHETWVGSDTPSGGGGGGGGRGGPGDAAWMAVWADDGRFGIYDHATDAPLPAFQGAETSAPRPRPGERVTIEVTVAGGDAHQATVTATLRTAAGEVARVEGKGIDRALSTDGYFGLVGRGLLDWEANRVSLEPGRNRPATVPVNELHVAYALGDTLREEDGAWRCRFLALFRGGEGTAEIRIADSPRPAGGWEAVPPAGAAPIVTNDFRRSTAVIDVRLPRNPSESSLYYTVWRDGRDVTSDPRIGTASTGPGTGFIGKVPASGTYVGRLPRLEAPYRVCGLSCHAVVGNRPDLPGYDRFQPWWVHDQPSPEAYRHLEDFGFQVMLWEDDIWYLEMAFPPPSLDDAYKVITATLAGPTTRWQMMRHWNVLNAGDHDYGMDDIKGPEQLIIRNTEGLGQDPEYMRRNFEMVIHLISGHENPSGTANPKWWRRWKMPAGDFSLLVLDSRLWRTSQDTNIWDDEGWEHGENLYDRRDPTRALLGEEQFAWLQEVIRTDTSPLICLTGINALHTLWQGGAGGFGQRDRAAADYAGWVSAGADRVLELLGSRSGVVSVYGDVHLGCILKSERQRVYEACFGPIGRSGGRSPKPDFGPRMNDYDGRAVEVAAFYHNKYGSPRLDPLTGPFYWNYLEMVFDPRPADPEFALRIRNVVDALSTPPRGGGAVEARAGETGRPPASRLPEWRTLPAAEVRISHLDGRPIRGVRALADGTVPPVGLVDVAPGTPVLVTTRRGEQAEAQVLRTRPPLRSGDARPD